MPINTWRGPCRYCTKPVGARKGLAEKSATTGKWLVAHSACDAKHAGPGRYANAPAPQPAELPAVRMPYKDD